MATSNRIRMNQFGLLENPVGLKVKLVIRGRTYLGDVRDVKYDEHRGMRSLVVHHFNGEKWPIEPAIMAVEVI